MTNVAVIHAAPLETVPHRPPARPAAPSIPTTEVDSAVQRVAEFCTAPGDPHILYLAASYLSGLRHLVEALVAAGVLRTMDDPNSVAVVFRCHTHDAVHLGCLTVAPDARAALEALGAPTLHPIR